MSLFTQLTGNYCTSGYISHDAIKKRWGHIGSMFWNISCM